MNIFEFIDGFDFKDETVLDKKVHSIRAGEMHCFIVNGQWNLAFEPKSPDGKLVRQAFAIRRFEQAGTESAVNLNGHPNHPIGQRVLLHNLCALCASASSV